MACSKILEDVSSSIDFSSLSQESEVLNLQYTESLSSMEDRLRLFQCNPVSGLERMYCDFSQNSPLKLADIIKSCFFNQIRKKITKDESGYQRNLLDDSSLDDADKFISRISDRLKSASKKFDEQKIRPLSHDRLQNSVNKVEFISDLIGSRWFGPYVNQNKDYYSLHTMTKQGVMKGLMIDMSFEKGVIFLYFVDQKGRDCGTYHYFCN